MSRTISNYGTILIALVSYQENGYHWRPWSYVITITLGDNHGDYHGDMEMIIVKW